MDLDDIKAVWLTVFYTSKGHRLSNPFNAKWTVLLRGDRADLVHLPGRFQIGPIRVVSALEAFYLFMAELEGISDIKVARERVTSTIDVINGVMAISVRGFKPVEAYSLETQTGEHSFAVCNLAGEMALQRAALPESSLPVDDTPSQLVSLIMTDVATADVFRLFGRGRRDAMTLYKVYEIIRDDVGGDDVMVKQYNWTSSTQLSRFRNSMNNRYVLGDEARHATRTFTPPKTPMLLGEAEAFISRLIVNWLNTKT